MKYEQPLNMMTSVIWLDNWVDDGLVRRIEDE